MTTTDLSDLMRAASDAQPGRAWTVGELDRLARSRRAGRTRRAAAAGMGAAALIAGIGFLAMSPGPAPEQPPAASDVAQGFPVGSAIEAVLPALPTDVVVGDLPADIAWEGQRLEVPIVVDGQSALLVLDVGGSCSADSDALATETLMAVADAVCAARDAASAPLPNGGGPAS